MNVFACLVHEAPDCVHDLVDNLQCLDPESVVLLYDGSGGHILPRLGLSGRPGVFVHPRPRPMKWGRLHDFAIDSMRYALDHFEFETITVVDSDQVALRRGYSAYVRAFLEDHPGAGCLVSSEGRQPSTTTIGPARVAWQEVDLWRPFLKRFPDGEARFPQWTFWPSTVFTRMAVEDLLCLWPDPELQEILAETKIWASEEVILPSLVALSGHGVIKSPCSYDLVQYRARYSVAQLGTAMLRRDVFWAHPVPRLYSDPLRAHVRKSFGGYVPSATTTPDDPFESPGGRPLPLLLPLLKRAEAIDGWLSAVEADLLSSAVTRALLELPAPHAIVEVGSYCGRATVVLGTVAKSLSPGSAVYAVDPHDGVQGERGKTVPGLNDSRSRFARNIEAAGLNDVVHQVVAEAGEVAWDIPISFLVVDRLHDYASVATDFAQFQAHLVPGGLVAFHDYADYFPGVQAFVGHLLETGAFAPVQQVESMVVLKKTGTVAMPAIGELLHQMGALDGQLSHDEAALLALTAAISLSRSDTGAIVQVGAPDPRATRALASAAAAAGRPGALRVGGPGAALPLAADAGSPTSWRRPGSTAVPNGAVPSSVPLPLAGPMAGTVPGQDGAPPPPEICLLVVNEGARVANLAENVASLMGTVSPGSYIAFLNFATWGAAAPYGEPLRNGELERAFAVGQLLVFRRTRLAQKSPAQKSPAQKSPAQKSPAQKSPAQRNDAKGLRADSSLSPPLQPTATPRASSDGPLVSCVMPTHDRRLFVGRAIRCWLQQDYSRSELVVVDDGTDRVDDLVPDDRRVRYVPLPERQTIGAKRNIGCKHALGDLIVHWDDDDWSAPWRLSYQVEMFQKQDVDVSGLSAVFFCDLQAGKAWRYEYPFQRRPWVADATFCYRRSLWEASSFPDSSYGIDTTYLWKGAAKRVGALSDPSFYVAMVHSGNTSRKDVSDAWWHPHPISEIASLMGADWDRYKQEH
jgi:hypothetical protein